MMTMILIALLISFDGENTIAPQGTWTRSETEWLEEDILHIYGKLLRIQDGVHNMIYNA
jgi:hypothetical protein